MYSMNSTMKGQMLLLILSLSFFACKPSSDHTETHQEEAHLGVVQMEITGNAEAQEYFTEGLLLLHSFEYEDAREQFLAAQEADSTCLMAYWGEAMTHNHTLWQYQELDEAREALSKLAQTPEERKALAQTEIEKAFIEAIDILLGEGTKYERDLAYKDYMEKLNDQYPDNHEISAFYAVSLLGASRNGRDEELYEKSARIVQGVINENPDHPGALHYLIHSYDDPDHAHLASLAADSYSEVAPDAAHALHMPSHIYVALGKWNDVVKSNIASWNASVQRKGRKELDNDALSYHALSWLQYGLLQRGEFALADSMLSKMVMYQAEKDDKGARSYLIAMKGAHLVETNDWTGNRSNITIDANDLNIVKRAGNNYINGMVAYKGGNTRKLSEVISEMKKDRTKAELRVGDRGFAMCSSGGFASKPPNQMDIDMAQIMEWQLMALEAEAKGDDYEAESYYVKAVNKDVELKYSYGPPLILKPVAEAYGEWLLEKERYEDALEVFTVALDRQPRRLISLKGKITAARALENKAEIRTLLQEIAEITTVEPRAPVL